MSPTIIILSIFNFVSSIFIWTLIYISFVSVRKFVKKCLLTIGKTIVDFAENCIDTRETK